ncbi:MAG: VWA domain-containing protein [Acetatifactor sp.]|nr:VWA domain-containing protein [Acetatifactor sp.]MDE7112569.1 VWA domain-containing protein [Acetatifactor sp.]
MEDWVLEFDFDREITEIWNGVIEEHEGNHYVVRNATYNSTIVPGGSVFFGMKGCGGETGNEPINYILYSYRNADGYVVKFCVGAEDVDRIPKVQIISDGKYVTKPENPMREGYYFIGWYVDESFSEKFDFENTAVHRNITLYARWLDYLCQVDTDQDGIVDSLEEYFGTDVFDADTDKDGLTDYEEVYITGTNPLIVDTDNNGIDDYNDDLDNDGIINGDEVKNGTNPAYYDTDIDGLSDYEEMYEYFTDPTVKDSDGDGASDGWELQNGYDPLVYNDSFALSASIGRINEANPVIASVNVEVHNADVESLNIDKVKSHDNCYITPSIAGYIGDAYDFTLNGEFDVAELIFEYDINIGEISEEFQPRIYYFNEETKSFEELENQIVENGKVIAYTTHFSTYILLNKIEFDKVWNNEIRVSSNGENLNIAFVVDLSGSMSGTKLSTTKSAINSFIDVLEDEDKAAIVSFTNSATVSCNMTDDKVTLKNAVKSMRASGLTSIYKGIEKAIGVFEDAETDGYKMMIVFTDGYDEPSTRYDIHYRALVEMANEKDIVIYTIGISTIDEALLTKVAESTGGKYYYASVISELQGKVDEIKDETIDYKKDSNNDGISDYHTKLIEEGILVLSNSSNELKGVNLNYDDKGNLTDDCDGDGLKNGEEIKVVEKNGRIYLEMISHPLREYSDGDIMSDYEEVQNGTDPLRYEANKYRVDRLCTDGFYYFETTAGDLRDDEFVRGLIGYSAIINGVWNKQELYRDLIIDYYSTYVTQDTIDDIVTDEEKKLWYDTLVTWSSNANKYGKVPYDTIYNINKLISYVNGATNVSQMEGDFVKRVSSLIVEINKVSEDATELRFDVAGLPYVKKYFDSDIVKQVVGSSQKTLDKCSNGISFLVYGADVVDTITSLSQIEANKAAFNENVDALEVLSIFGSDRNIRAAANEVMDVLAKEYLQVYASAIGGDIFEAVGDFVLYQVASKVGYVAVVVAVRDVMNLLVGSKADVEQMYRILCYSDMCEAYSKSLFWKIHVTDNQRYYYCYNQDNVMHITRYLENIAQLRILGEQEYYKYIKNDGLLGFVVNYLSELDKLKEEIEDTISKVKECADFLKLHISSKMQYAVQ